MSVPASLIQWALRHRVSYAAVQDLCALLGTVRPNPAPADGAAQSEAHVQSAVTLEAPKHGVLLFRNNVGALRDARGRLVRYGLANDSAALNKRLKSSDLIGWRRVLIQPHHVGSTIAQFTARECKPSDWVWSGSAHEVAQLNFINLVTADGGDAAFATSPLCFERKT